MCIFAGPVENVSGTRIFVSRQGDKQFTAYQMEVSLALTPGSGQDKLDPWSSSRPTQSRAKVGNAMILPVPCDSGSQIELVDLSGVPDMFDQLDAPFIERTRGMSKMSRDVVDHLEVYDVGDYKVSIAYTLADIDRADPSVFALSEDTSRVLADNYAEGFAFVIASLKNSGKISPLGYISTIPASLKDATYPLFIPSRAW